MGGERERGRDGGRMERDGWRGRERGRERGGMEGGNRIGEETRGEETRGDERRGEETRGDERRREAGREEEGRGVEERRGEGRGGEERRGGERRGEERRGSKHQGMATFVRTGITWSAVKRSPSDSNIEWLVTEVQETTIVNVYKHPPSELYSASLPSVPAPAIYAGDFNCQHTDWGYKQTTKDGETLSDWASSAEAVLLYNPKEPRASSLHDGTHTPTRNWHSPWAVAATQSQNDASLIDSPVTPSAVYHQSAIAWAQPIAGKPVKR